MSANRYLPRARHLHWIMAVLVLLAYALILSRTQLPRGSFERGLVVASHFWAGIIIFILVWPRLAFRRRHAPPAIQPPLSRGLQTISHLTHYLLYAFLVVMPILGVFTVLLERGGLPVPAVSILLPSPFPIDKDMAETLEHYHVLLGTISYYVVGLHVIAALWHHFVRKDDVLRRMV